MMRRWLTFLSIGLLLSLMAGVSLAQEEAKPAETPAAAAPAAAAPAEAAPAAAPGPTVEERLNTLDVTMDTIWVLVTAMLVFFMNLGFACVESGMCRARTARTSSRKTSSCSR